MTEQVFKKASWTDWLSALVSPDSRVTIPHCNFDVFAQTWQGLSNAFARNLIVCVERGQLTADAAGERFDVRAGMLLWLPPGCQKRFVMVPDTTVHRLHVRVECDGTGCSPVQEPSLRQCAPLLAQQFRHVRDTVRRPPTGDRDALLRGLLVLISDAFRCGEPPGRPKALGQGRRDRIDALLREYISEPLTSADLAHAVDLTPDYFRRVFRRAYGVSPRTFIKQERLRIAAGLLQDSVLSVKAVAHRVGMPDVSFFCREFRRLYDCTPNGFRNRA